jgi:hypothetical protein
MKPDGRNPMVLIEEDLPLEKRKYPRFNVNLPVKYSRTNLIFRYARAVNASQGGLLVYLPEEIAVGQRLDLKIFFPSHPFIPGYIVKYWKDVHEERLTWDYRTYKICNVSPEHE